jgi:hypothetical protein
MCGHCLVEPTACTPGAGWEKGQVENQVGNIRERLFAPRLRVASYAELNAWLLDHCIVYAKANKHPELADRTIWQVFEAERSQLVPIGSRFNGFRATQASVSKTCLVRFDNNKYSVASRAVGRPVEIQAYAECIVIRQSLPRRRPGTASSSASMRAVSAATRRSTIRGITCRCWPENPARSGTARRSGTGCCRPIWSACGSG